MIELINHVIDIPALLDRVQTPATGAVVLFLGTTRETTAGRQTESLDYQCYPEMAHRKLTELETEAKRRWPITECCIVHRLGHLLPGEVSVAVAVSTPHRASGSVTRQNACAREQPSVRAMSSLRGSIWSNVTRMVRTANAADTANCAKTTPATA